MLPTVLRTVKLIAAGVHHMGFYLLLFKWKYCMHALKRIRNWYFDRTPQKNTMSQNIVQNKNNIPVNGSFILHFLSFSRSNLVSK